MFKLTLNVFVLIEKWLASNRAQSVPMGIPVFKNFTAYIVRNLIWSKKISSEMQVRPISVLSVQYALLQPTEI